MSTLKYGIKATLIGLVPITVVAVLALSGLIFLVGAIALVLFAALGIGTAILEGRKEASEDEKDWYEMGDWP